MKFQKQLNVHNPEAGSVGDCYRTVLACFLDMDPAEIPNFGEDEDWLQTSADWLWDKGYYPVRLVFAPDPGIESLGHKNIDLMLALNNPGMYYMLAGNSAGGVGHVVICLDGEIVWDPSPAEVGILGPNDDGCYSVEFLAPTQFVNKSSC